MIANTLTTRIDAAAIAMLLPEAADAMGLPLRTVERLWTYAKAWLYHRLQAE